MTEIYNNFYANDSILDSTNDSTNDSQELDSQFDEDFSKDSEVDANEPVTHSEFKPINDYILGRRIVEDNTKVGSFILPDRYRQQSNRAEVLALGHKVTSSVKVGDIVTFGVYNVEKFIQAGEELLLIAESDVRGFEEVI